MFVVPAPAELLPTVADRPLADVVIFDGHCRICTGQIRRLARWDTRGRLAFVSLHDPLVAARWPELSREQLMRDMYVVDRRGRRHAGAAAFRYLSRKIPRLWCLAPLLHVPGAMPLWQALYRLIANRRYALGGQAECADEACAIHRRR